jgi:hypothetical protein
MNNQRKPPRIVDKFLEWFLPEHLLEDVQGDLHEVFYKQVAQSGFRQARKEYLLATVRYIRPYFFKRRKKSIYYTKPLYLDMFRNYLTIAFRSLVKKQLVHLT